MKTIVTKSVNKCDVCGEVSDYLISPCQYCGKDICYDCMKKLGVVEYIDGLYCYSRSYYYCKECDKKAKDPLHESLSNLNAFRIQLNARSASDKMMQDKLEGEVKSSAKYAKGWD